MADQIPVLIHSLVVEIWGPPAFAYETLEEFDAANQKMVDNLDLGIVKYEIDRTIPPGYFVKNR